MTTVANAGADAFIRRLPKDLRFFLVHGSDEGLTRERSRAIVDALLGGDRDPMRLIRFDGDAISREPGALAEEADAVSMFGGSRVIWIDAGARDIGPALAPLIARPPRDCAIVVEAGALKKGAALRVAFETMAHGAAIECYPDDKRAIVALIEAQARDAGLAIAPEVRDYLASLLGADRGITRGEIAKLMLYAKGAGAVAIADVEAIVSDAAPSTLDAAVDHAFAGDSAGVEAAANQYFSVDGGDAESLMRAIVARALLLHRARLAIDEGRSLESALQGQLFRLSPQRRAALERQSARWTTERLTGIATSLRTTAARIRTDPKLAAITATRALWAIASNARARGP